MARGLQHLLQMYPRITFPTFLLQEHLRHLAQARRPWVDVPVGLSWQRQGVGVELIVARQASPAHQSLRLWLGENFQPPDFTSVPQECRAILHIGVGTHLGMADARIREQVSSWLPAAQLALVGPGMHLVPLQATAGHSPRAAKSAAADAAEVRWSRTLGALGAENYRRLVDLRVGLIGCGRSGSLMAYNLAARLGVRGLVLVDLDRVELHNAGEGEFAPFEVGHTKVEALRRRILRERPDAEVHAVCQTVTHLEAIEALKNCDVLVSAPDQPAARLAAGALAVAYARPLIDIGTRVHRIGPNTMGADIRLIGPERCLLCFGGVNQEDMGRRLLESPDAEQEFQMLRDWREERPGSLRSLNEISAAAAQRALEDLAAARIAESVWCHLEFGQHGRLAVSYPEPQRAAQPCACNILGWGDASLSRFGGILRRRREATADAERGLRRP